MSRQAEEREIWYWYHNISECHYHIQLTVKYRKALLSEDVQRIIKATMTGYKERYTLDVSEIGFDHDRRRTTYAIPTAFLTPCALGAGFFTDAEAAVNNYFQQKKKRQQENTRFDFLTTIDISRPDLQEQLEKTVVLIENAVRK